MRNITKIFTIICGIIDIIGAIFVDNLLGWSISDMCNTQHIDGTAIFNLQMTLITLEIGLLVIGFGVIAYTIINEYYEKHSEELD